MTPTFVFHVDEPFPEGSTPQFQLTLVDELGVALTPGTASAITASLIDARTEAVVNSRDQQDVNGVNGGQLAASGGLFTLQFSIADMAILDSASTYETRKLVLDWTYASATKRGGFTFVFRVANRFKS